MFCAVTRRLSSPIRVATISPMSSGSPTRPKAVRAASSGMTSGKRVNASSESRVRVAPGETALTRMDLEELRTLLARHARPDATTAVEGVLVSKVDRSDPPEPAMTATVLAVIAQGTKRLAVGDRVLEYGPGQHLVASVDLPVTGQFVGASPEHPAPGFGLVLDPSAVAELLLHPGTGSTPRTGGGAVPALAVCGDRDEPDPVPETDPAPGGPPHARHPAR